MTHLKAKSVADYSKKKLDEERVDDILKKGPMEPRWKNLIYTVSAIITAVVVLVFLLRVFGVWNAPLLF